MRIDRKRKFLGSIFLRALGLRSTRTFCAHSRPWTDLLLRDKKLYWTLDSSADRAHQLCWA